MYIIFKVIQYYDQRFSLLFRRWIKFQKLFFFNIFLAIYFFFLSIQWAYDNLFITVASLSYIIIIIEIIIIEVCNIIFIYIYTRNITYIVFFWVECKVRERDFVFLQYFL